MSETQTAVGVLAGITEKPTGWSTISVSRIGSDYPLKLDTKIPELIELARAAGQETMEWRYTEEDSGTPNPHRPGSNYVNRRFVGVSPVGSTPESATDSVATPAAAAKGSGGESLSKDEWAAKDRAADLRACIAIAGGALQHTIPSSPTDEDLNEYVRRVLLVARQYHRIVQFERTGDELSEHDQNLPF